MKHGIDMSAQRSASETMRYGAAHQARFCTSHTRDQDVRYEKMLLEPDVRASNGRNVPRALFLQFGFSYLAPLAPDDDDEAFDFGAFSLLRGPLLCLGPPVFVLPLVLRLPVDDPPLVMLPRTETPAGGTSSALSSIGGTSATSCTPSGL